MNSNKFLDKLNNLIISVKTEKEAQELMSGLFTQNEIETLKKRWRILEMLNQGATQRQIAQDLNVSLCKVTRGAKVLKEKSILTEFLNERRNNE